MLKGATPLQLLAPVHTRLLSFEAPALLTSEDLTLLAMGMTIANEGTGFLTREPLATAAKVASLAACEFLLPRVAPATRECTSLASAATVTAALESTHLWRPEGTPSAAAAFECLHLRRCKSAVAAALAAASSVHRRKAASHGACLAASSLTAALAAAAHEDAGSTASMTAAFAAAKCLGRATTAATAPVVTAARKRGGPTLAVRIASPAVAFARLCCSGTCNRERCDACCEE